MWTPQCQQQKNNKRNKCELMYELSMSSEPRLFDIYANQLANLSYELEAQCCRLL